MRRWVECGIVAFIAWVGLGAACVEQGPMSIGDEDAGASDPVTDREREDQGRPRGTVTSGLDITGFRSLVSRTDGSLDDVGDEEIFFATGNRATIYLMVLNASGGWIPINFELCVDSSDVLAVIDPNAEPPETGAIIEGPCAVRYPDGYWPIVEHAQEIEFRAGTVEAKPQAGGGYMTVYFRADFPEAGVLDLFEYTVPYRVLPPDEPKEMYVPRKAVLRRLTIDLP